MAENLDYAVDGSKCYGNDTANCVIYGRLYDWSTAMSFASSCNSSTCSSQIQSPHRGICPSGWHIPSSEDWGKLTRYADGTSGTFDGYYSPTAGKYLKAASGWNSYGGVNGNGTDQHGFSALPGGDGYSDGSFRNIGNEGDWWSTSEYNNDDAYHWGMYYGREYAYWGRNYKDRLFSVRCIQD
jgi:uncharacterized protein (TIGR02145 family)